MVDDDVGAKVTKRVVVGVRLRKMINQSYISNR